VRWISLIVGIGLGVLLLGLARFAFVEGEEPIHYHANWALFIDGERVDLSADRYMEDVVSCSPDPGAVRPRDRVHLHENNMDVVHVHHDGATWGHLMANLGFGLGHDWLITDDGRRLFAGEEGRDLVFVVDGMQVPTLHDREIESEDRVVISMGSEDPATVREEFLPRVASNAAEFNEEMDPAGCAGGHGPRPVADRLRDAFWGPS
jgi:hypothetical protein